MGNPDGSRWWLRAVVIVGVLLLAAAAGYRVLAPAEVITPARDAYPVARIAPSGVIGTMSEAPLIIDGRLRVYAGTRQVHADGPVDAKTTRTPFWSYRRWPAQLTGVVASGATVISQWSDGELVALDGRTGQVSWRARGPQPQQQEYAGRRTGAATVYAPVGLYIASSKTGPTTLVVAGATEWSGVAMDTGQQVWRADASCRSAGFTTTNGSLVAVDTCAAPQPVQFYDAATGELAGQWRPDDAGAAVEIEPVGCAEARSTCAGLRTTSDEVSRGWLLDGTTPVASSALNSPDAWLVDDIVVEIPTDGQVRARSARDNTQRWQRDVPAGTRVLAVQPKRIHLLTGGRYLITLEAGTGRERSRFILTQGDQPRGWEPGLARAAAGYVAVERLTTPVRPAEDDAQYYIDAQPVILAGT